MKTRITCDERYAGALRDVLREIEFAEEKHPQWPDDIVHQAAIVAEESGELVQAALQYHYERNMRELNSDPFTEATQTAAMALRFMVNSAAMRDEKGGA